MSFAPSLNCAQYKKLTQSSKLSQKGNPFNMYHTEVTAKNAYIPAYTRLTNPLALLVHRDTLQHTAHTT